MGLCQDCAKEEAEYIIFDKDKNMSFLVCVNCIDKEKDIIMNQSIKQIVEFYSS